MTKQEAIVVSAYTGYLLCPFNDMHKYIEEKLGRPVFTHEMGNTALWEEVRALTKDDFVALAVKE